MEMLVSVEQVDRGNSLQSFEFCLLLSTPGGERLVLLYSRCPHMMNRGNLEGTILVPVKNLEQELFRLFSTLYV